MDELIDILDDSGNFTGKTALKSEAHKKGLFHPTVHVWCYSKSRKILLQQRGAQKKTYPLKWDVSVAGHIGAGESIETGAFREVQEEIGVTIEPSELEKIIVFKKDKKHPNGVWDREFTSVFIYRLDDEISLSKQDSEVEALKWLAIEEFKQWINRKHLGLIPNSEERFYTVISEIESRL
ncbi:hypothetical protein MTsPCn9_03870 [Croceitalea sp. MTPC9]|uniref:NUDIX hydrolase n=1 Tax=unclassified Croceitalea TaxID=2632280 RepID=UPI002B3E7252|nr:hypothetical protein MTsPCn6_04840 [Croceitalea sp. MTPC6]GMN15451.1 hypothetical protein MTsPCn9_03870 [Croceitalea sp. MTPC9]